MRIAALATGAGVPAHDFAGRVIEIHARAALIKLRDGWCVTLLGRELGRQPRGISLDLPADISLQQLVSVNAELAKRGGVLRFAKSAVTIDLRRAPPWNSGIAALDFDCRKPAVARAYRTAASALQRDGRSQGLRDIAGAQFDRLSAAIQTRDLAAAERAFADLIGLGEGKTPAGDDYLVGICAALWSCPAGKAFAAALRPKLMVLTARSSDLSSLYLQEAARGQISERLFDVAAGICAGGSDKVVGNAVTRALDVGHSSGAAGIFGLLNGYAACAATPFQASADSVLSPTF
jgi:Protein of unknown function (DUF2877)